MMGMMQVVRERVLHPLGAEDLSNGRRGERFGEDAAGLEGVAEEDEMLLLPLAEGCDGAAGDVGLILC